MDLDRPIVRWSLVVLWAFVALLLYEPAAAFVGWPLLLAALAAGVIWTAQDFIAVRHQTEMIREGRVWLHTVLVTLGLLAGAVVVLATAESMRKKGHGFALSTVFAPELCAVVLVATLRAMRLPTPRRIVIASLVTLTAVPVLAAIRIFSVPVVDADDFSTTWMVTAYSLCILAMGAIGIHLGIVGRRHGYGDDIPADPPKATLAQ